MIDTVTNEQEPREGLTPTQALWEVGDDNQKILTWFYIVAALLVGYVLGAFYQFAIDFVLSKLLIDSSLALQMERFSENYFSPAYVLSGLTALAAGIYCRRTPKVNQFGVEVVAELRKVTWSTWDTTWKSTLAVIVIVLICAMILGVFDLLWGGLSNQFLR